MFRLTFEEDLLFKELQQEIPTESCVRAIYAVIFESRLRVKLDSKELMKILKMYVHIYIELVGEYQFDFPTSMSASIAVELIARLKVFMDYFRKDFIFDKSTIHETLLPVVVVSAKYGNDVANVWNEALRSTRCWSQTEVTLTRLFSLEKYYLATISYALYINKEAASNTHCYLLRSMFYRSLPSQCNLLKGFVGFDRGKILTITESPDALPFKVREIEGSVCDDDIDSDYTDSDLETRSSYTREEDDEFENRFLNLPLRSRSGQ